MIQTDVGADRRRRRPVAARTSTPRRTYNLARALRAVSYRKPQQGFHIKLTIHADGAQGNDTKYKVFWVTGCQPPT